jgi:hypothetical protein
VQVTYMAFDIFRDAPTRGLPLYSTRIPQSPNAK